MTQRRFFKNLVFFVALLFLGAFSTAHAAYTDLSFDPGTGAGGGAPFVSAIAIQSDGKIIIGGQFDSYNGTPKSKLARVNVDGSLDTSFDPGTGVSPSVSYVALQSDDKLLISGSFNNYNGTNRRSIARVNSDGSLDTSFDPGSSVGLSATVVGIAVQSDGKIIIIGDFTTYQGTSRVGIARVNSDGSLDTSFDPGTGATGGSIRRVVIQSDGKIIIIGDFTTYQGTSRVGIARVNSDGSLDTSFDPGTGATSVSAIALQSNGKMIISGSFTAYNGTNKNGIARVNSDGSLDTSFDPGVGANSTIAYLAIQPLDQKIVIAGNFSTYGNESRTRIARVDINGDLDTTFNPQSGVGGPFVYALTLQTDGKILVGGDFSTVIGISRHDIVRISLVPYIFTYTAGTHGSITGSASQSVGEGYDGTAVTAVSDTGYHFLNWSDGSTQNPRTDTNASGDISVIASFAINTQTLTYTAGAHGSITGTSPQSVNYGSSGTAVTAVPDSGYVFIDWSDTSTDNPRTDTNVTGDISVTANFGYSLDYTAGVHGSLTGTTSQKVLPGGSGTAVTAVPSFGYAFLNWSDASTDNPRTDTNISGNISVTANFIATHTLNYLSGTGGTLTGSTSQTVVDGGSGTAVTAVPSTGYIFVNWSDGSTQNPRTDTNVTVDITVTANFTQQYTLTYIAGTGGTISGSTSQTVANGGNGTAVTAVPNSGWVFYNWSDASTSNPRTDTSVGSDISMTANFRHSLTYAAGTGGTLTGSTSQTVVDGGSGTAVTAVPSTGYIFVNWSDGSTQNPRTDTNVTTNVSVTANFSSYYIFSYSTGPILNSGMGASSTVSAVAVQSDGKIIIGGNFTTYNGTARAGIARLNSDGTLDTSFDPGTGTSAGSTVNAIAIQPSDGKIIIGGTFVSYNSTSRARIARINTDGTLDTSFDPGTGAASTVNAIAIQPSDGKILIGGSFTSYNSTSRVRIARINTDGTLDTSFAPGTGAVSLSVNAIVVQPDGKILIGGGFTTYASTSRPRIARINTNGTLDTSFTPGTGANSGIVNAIALQSDGKAVIVGSTFTTYNGTSRLRIARVNTDGTLDTSFDPGTGVGATVSAIALQSDGKVIITGTITTYNGIARVGIARINTDGTLDTSFDPGTGGSAISAIGLESSGDAIIGGTFTIYSGITSNRVARAFLATTDHGSITGSVSQNVASGSSGTAVTAVADTAYHFVNWSDGSTQNPRTDTNASAHIAVYANFAASTLYSLNYSAGAHGSLTGSTSQSVYETESGTAVTAVPDVGYTFVDWSDASTDNPRTDTNVTGDISVTANFEVNPPTTHSLMYISGTGGTLTGTASQTVNDASDGTAVTAVPNIGYTFTNWSDGSTQNPRTDTNVTEDITVTANFSANPVISNSGGVVVIGVCGDPNAINYSPFGMNKPELCKYTLIASGSAICPVSQLLTQNLKAPSQNGKYNSFTKGIVKEANILQTQLIRLGFLKAKANGVIGSQTNKAIKLFQIFHGLKPDGYVGPLTRNLINHSCGD